MYSSRASATPALAGAKLTVTRPVNRRRVLRRRFVVAILLLLCIGMLTAYFRDSNSGVAHDVQNGVLQVVAPLQSGTARVTKPFRDAWNWAGDLFGAKAENARLRRQLAVLQAGVADQLATQAQNTEMSRLLGLQHEHIFPQGVTLVSGRVVARSTSAWYSTVTIDAGSSRGVRVNDAVVNGDGLVGRVTQVYAAESQVTLLTDQQSFVDAMVLPGGATGMVAGSVTGDVTLEYVDKSEKVKVGQDVVTSGMSRSIFTRGIPIGAVQSVGTQDVELYQSVPSSPTWTSASSTSCRWCSDELSRSGADEPLSRGRAPARSRGSSWCLSSPSFCRPRVAPNCASWAPTRTSPYHGGVGGPGAGRRGGRRVRLPGGLLVAMALIQPLGLSAFVLVLVGYFAGRYAETADLSAGLRRSCRVRGQLVADVLLAIAQSLLDRQVPWASSDARAPAVAGAQHAAGGAGCTWRCASPCAGQAICVWPGPGRDPVRRDRPIRTGRRDKPVIQLPSVALRVAIAGGPRRAALRHHPVPPLVPADPQRPAVRGRGQRQPAAHQSSSWRRAARSLDRNGKVIVDNRPGLAVGIRLMDVPDQLNDEIARLAPGCACGLRDPPADQGCLRPSTFATDAHGKVVSFLTWHEGGGSADHGAGPDTAPAGRGPRSSSTYRRACPGASPAWRCRNYLRAYPQGDLAAQLLGTSARSRGAAQGSRSSRATARRRVVGQGGVE